MDIQQLAENFTLEMTDQYSFVNSKRNPVSVGMNSLEIKGLLDIINQYTFFSRNTVSFLSDVRDNAAASGWTKVVTELERNIGEERGSQTGGLSHYDIFIRGLEENVDYLWMDLIEPGASEATRDFVNGIRKITGDPRAAYSVGGAYGLEAPTVPELTILQGVANKLAVKLTGRRMQDGNLKRFFDAHISTWEPGHESNLRNTAAKYILSSADLKLFESGFRDVMSTMDRWWAGLYSDSRYLC